MTDRGRCWPGFRHDVARRRDCASDHPDMLPPGTAAKELANDRKPIENFPSALKAGVKIAYGADIGEGDHARDAADLIGASDRIGSIQPGRFADMVVVAGDPLADAAQFEKVIFVMKGGVVYKRNGEPTGAQGR